MRKAILFDVDRTLAARQPLHRRALDSACTQQRAERNGALDVYRFMLPLAGAGKRMSAYFGRHGGALAQEPLVARYRLPIRHDAPAGPGAAALHPGAACLREPAHAATPRTGAAAPSDNIDALAPRRAAGSGRGRMARVLVGRRSAQQRLLPQGLLCGCPVPCGICAADVPGRVMGKAQAPRRARARVADRGCGATRGPSGNRAPD